MTVTLDADVAARLRALARARGISFKQALNNAERAGLAGERCAARSFACGARPGAQR